MVFGLGKKEEVQAPAPTQQMSAEAMAMLSQMTQQGGNAQAAPMAPSLQQPGAAPPPPATGDSGTPDPAQGQGRGRG